MSDYRGLLEDMDRDVRRKLAESVGLSLEGFDRWVRFGFSRDEVVSVGRLMGDSESFIDVLKRGLSELVEKPVVPDRSFKEHDTYGPGEYAE